MTIIQNNRLTNWVAFNCSIYNKNSFYQNIDYYKCKEKGCDSRLNLINNEYFSDSNQYNDALHKIDVLQQLAINEMKKGIIHYFNIWEHYQELETKVFHHNQNQEMRLCYKPII